MTREMIVPEGQEWAPQMFKMAPGLRVGDHVYLSGVVVVPKDEGDDALEAGIEETFGMIEATLKAAGGSWDDAVDVTTFHVDLERQKEPFMRVKDRYIKGSHFPAWTAVGVTRLWGLEMVLEIKVTAVIPAKPN